MSFRCVPSPVQAIIDGLRWPLDPHSSPPLYFEPLEKMIDIRRKTPLPTSTHDCKTPEAAAMAQDVIGTVDLLASSGNVNDLYYHYARVATALLLLGHGYTDEAHCLISPLSFPQETPFGYGPLVATEGDLFSVSAYAHSLVHRREAFHPSEFNLTGFGNAHYWTSATIKGDEIEVFTTVRQVVLDIAGQKPFADSPSVQSWCDSMVASEEVWEPRMLHDLCAKVMSQTGSDDALFQFAERIAEVELRSLLAYTLHKLGFDCGDCLRS